MPCLRKYAFQDKNAHIYQRNQNQSYARDLLLSLKIKMFVPSLARLKIQRELDAFKRVVVGGHVRQNERSTKEYNDRCVREDFNGMT